MCYTFDVSRSLVVVPTYNEAANIERLVKEVLANTHPQTHVLIADDNSPDGTGKLADALVAKNQRIHALHRPAKLGLGSTYRDSFLWAIKSGYEFIYQIDSDFSHDPRTLVDFQACLESGSCDVVVGTRYTKGGKIEDWNFLRRFISRFGCLYAQAWLRMPVSDMTGGFNGWKAAVLEKIQIANIVSEGYCFQIELKYKAYRTGFRIEETPIVFSDRKLGKSKMNHRIVIEAVWRVPVMALRRA